MRLWLTGGTGFVGSNVLEALDAGHEVTTTVNTFIPPPDAPYTTELVEMTDAAAVMESVKAFEPDVVVHCAILNDYQSMYADRTVGWDAYVGATRATLAASRAVDASYVLVSTDWVFDGTQSGADEATPPNPINLYGMFKFASEMVTLEGGGAVARVSGVIGLHRTRPSMPRAQDRGYGYFVASLVDRLSAGDTFDVWESESINMRATPSLASECAEIILRVGQQRMDGVFHCCGADDVGRMELAEMACEVFRLDASRLRSTPPDPRIMSGHPDPI